jgi:hypothetical protein
VHAHNAIHAIKHFHPKDSDKSLYEQFSLFFFLMRRIRSGSIPPEDCKNFSLFYFTFGKESNLKTASKKAVFDFIIYY